MPRDGGLMTRLTNGAGFDIQPAWSPDGRQIAFINTDSFMGGKLQIIDAATGKLVRESQDLQVYGNLYFDPTNRRVLGIFHPTNRRPRLAWFHVQTGELTNAVADGAWPGPSIGTTGLEWPRIALSHNGKTLAVVVTRDQPNEQPGNQGPQVDVWLVSMAGGPPRQLHPGRRLPPLPAVRCDAGLG
mgnify:CR=1 FL=1